MMIPLCTYESSRVRSGDMKGNGGEPDDPSGTEDGGRNGTIGKMGKTGKHEKYLFS